MAGRTGKRARPAGRCWRCGGQIRGEFERDRSGDRHVMSPDGTYACVKGTPVVPPDQRQPIRADEYGMSRIADDAPKDWQK